MKKTIFTLLIFMVLLFTGKTVLSQDAPVHPIFIGSGVFLGETPPLRDLPPVTLEEYEIMVANAHKKFLNPKLGVRSFPFADQALPKGPDEAWQKTMGTIGDSKAPIANFSGSTSPFYPSDCNGTAGPNHFMQTINCVYAIYSKTGALVAGPTNMNLLFGNVPGATYNDGDPLVLYDEQAQRYLAVEFSISGSNNYMLVAVSTSNDPTGTWFKYSFDVDDMPDYEKFGVWQDGYYMGDNNSASGKKDIYVFQRSVMLNGGASPAMIGFDNPNRPTSIDGFMCVPPLDNDGPAAPAGTPGIFITMNDNAIGGGSDQLWIYELAANWTTPNLSTFTRVQQLNVTAFDSNFGNNWNNIVQKGTTQKVDAIPQVIMNPPQYRNFGTYQTIVCCHTVDVDNTNHAGVRWYELRRGTQTSGGWSIRQQGTYAPDIHSRWMGSIMLNGFGQIGLGYSISSSDLNPGIRYTGQSSAAYNSAAGIMDIAEGIIINPTTSQTSQNRWGDYAQMSVDPADDKTFWFTSQYGGSRQTKIASFKLSFNPAVTTLDATAIEATTATINGTVNPNGLATTYHFEWGTTTGYGNSTATISAGSGTLNVSVSENISGLSAGIPYHFRLVAVNPDGTTEGDDLTFMIGTLAVTTTAASSISMSGATAGGVVVSDNGVAATARGTCWSTSANPTISDDLTTDGSGLGAFTSTITGLSASTTYHIRAYATNSTGTYYGDDLTFITTCGSISLFPWNEGFENAGAIPNCWTQEQISSSGIEWTFITGNGSTYPATAHSGTFDACLKDATTGDNKTRLITPFFNLNSIASPTLNFWHVQIAQSGRQDQLFVYYRTSATGTWTLLASYTTATAAWTQRVLVLPNASSEYQIAFEGNAKYGRGVCIDDVSITGTVTNFLTVTPTNQSVAATAGSTTFDVASNTSWSATSNQAWCTITPSGSGDGVITANYTLNSSIASRVAQITVTVAGLTPVVVTVTQTGADPALSVTPSDQAVIYAAGSTSFDVTSNSPWTASSNQAWCTVTPSGTGNGTVTANYQQNNVSAPRVAQVTVTVAGLSPVVVTVTQDGIPCSDPSVFAGNDGSVCENGTYTISGATASNYSTLLWTTSGSGLFSNPNALNTDYTPAIADYGTTVTLTLIAQPISPCVNPTSDSQGLFVQLLPTAYAGEDMTILDYVNLQLSATATNYLSLAWTSSGDGYFDASENTNTVYHPGANDIENEHVTITFTANPYSPCTLAATDALALTIMRQQTIELAEGWNGFSSFVVPLNPEFNELMNPVFEHLVISKTMTQVYWPQYGINTIGNFDVHQGYYVKMTEPATLQVIGFKSQEKTINLLTGWNILPVISENPVNSQELVDQIGANLIIVTEVAGSQILWPSAGIFSLVALIPGKAYLIKVSNGCSFTFPD